MGAVLAPPAVALLLAPGVALLLIEESAPPVSTQSPEPFVNPTPDPAEQARDAARYAAVDAGSMVGAKAGAYDDQISTDEPVALDHVKFDTGGFWNADEPWRLAFPADGFYSVTAQVTVLGSGYKDSPPSPEVFVSVVRNSDPTDFVCIDGLTQQDPAVALHISCHAVDWFLAGDYVELFVTPNRRVESNWPGRGNISPVLSVHWVD